MSMSFSELIQQLEALAYHFGPAILLLIVGRILLGVLLRAANLAMTKAKVDATLKLFLERVFFFAGMAFVAVIAISHVGVDTTPLIAAVGAAGFAAALAFKDSLSNLSAGVLLILFRPFKVGDFVEVAGQTGKVQRIDVFSTQLLSPDNKWTTIPNGKIANANITNFSRMPTRRVDMVISVSYGDDLKKAKEILLDMCANHEKVLEEPAPVVAVSDLADSSVNFIVRPWVKREDYWQTKWWFMEHVGERLEEAGITIPFTQYDVHIHQEDKSK